MFGRHVHGLILRLCKQTLYMSLWFQAQLANQPLNLLHFRIDLI